MIKLGVKPCFFQNKIIFHVNFTIIFYIYLFYIALYFPKTGKFKLKQMYWQ
jgi:hypothetical protein